MIMRVNGKCHCGTLVFNAEVDEATAGICHCVDCQTMSGSAFRWSVSSLPDQFVFENGEPSTYVKTGASGNKRAQAFCPTCGTHIYSAPLGAPETVYRIRVGTLQQKQKLAPKKQIWCNSAQKWVGDLASFPANETQ